MTGTSCFCTCQAAVWGFCRNEIYSLKIHVIWWRLLFLYEHPGGASSIRCRLCNCNVQVQHLCGRKLLCFLKVLQVHVAIFWIIQRLRMQTHFTHWQTLAGQKKQKISKLNWFYALGCTTNKFTHIISFLFIIFLNVLFQQHLFFSFSFTQFPIPPPLSSLSTIAASYW